MALVKHLLNKFSSVLCRASVFASQGVGHSCANVYVPCRFRSHAIGVGQETLKHVEEYVEKQPVSVTEEEKKVTSDIISSVNQQIEERNHGRLFAIIHLCGKQFKVTTEDLVVVAGYWAPTIGDKLKLEKILLVGGSDFTLIGRPMLPHGLAYVEATVIEKTMSHTKTIFKKKRRKQYMRINFQRSEYTMLRINAIEITENVNVKKDVEGLERIF